MKAAMRMGAWPVFALVLLLAGCATSTMSLSPDQIESIRIERVDVVYQTDAYISWEKVETVYVEQAKARQEDRKPWKQIMLEDKKAAENEFQRIINTPEGKRYVRDHVTAALKERINAEIVPRYQGTRPVVLEITIHAFSIPGPVQRVVLGGSPVLGAETRLKDIETGEELAKLDKAESAYAGNGLLGVLVDQAFDDLEDRLIDAYVGQLLIWLAPDQA